MLSRYLTRRGLRVLCYHGFSFVDESTFRPKLFMKFATFRTRLEFLKKKRFSVVSLEEAVTRMKQGQLPDSAVVITIDDGFFSSYAACKWLLEFCFPATIYVTSYYVTKSVPIFRLVVQYIFWKTKKRSVKLSELCTDWPEECSLNTESDKIDIMWRVIRFGEELSSEDERAVLSSRLADLLDVNLELITTSRMLSLMSADDIRSLVSQGIDIQLHTHRHRELDDDATTAREIRDNRAVLEPIVEKKLEHLCYPSGVWSEKLWAGLIKNDIKSAATCDPGLNFPDSPILGLKRFLDGEGISQIEFESELAGYSHLLRQLRQRVKKVFFQRSDCEQTNRI